MDRYYRSEERELHHNSSNNSLPPSSSSSLSPDVEEEREYMFEKVVTPSDVGKLNRLVIPKHYAERYFPLDRASNEEAAPAPAGRLLSFEEDRGAGGRTWRFRYSYWNSSQSYVMTKGWSRFVKDKRLGAGDTVKFSRGASASSTGRLFIDWHYRPPPPDPPHLLRSSAPWGWGGQLFVPPPPPPPSSEIASAGNNCTSTIYYRSVGRPVPPLLRMGGRILDSVPLSVAAEPKRVRLFGVNLDCSEQKEEDYRPQQRESTNHLPPPSPLQWRLSPTPAPASRSELPQLPLPAMDQEGARRRTRLTLN